MNVDYSKYTVIQDGARIIGGDFVTVNGQPVAPDTTPPVFRSTDGTPLGKTPNGPGFSTPRGPPNATGGTPIYNSAGKVIRIKHGPPAPGATNVNSLLRPIQANQGPSNQAQRK